MQLHYWHRFPILVCSRLLHCHIIPLNNKPLLAKRKPVYPWEKVLMRYCNLQSPCHTLFYKNMRRLCCCNHPSWVYFKNQCEIINSFTIPLLSDIERASIIVGFSMPWIKLYSLLKSERACLSWPSPCIAIPFQHMRPHSWFLSISFVYCRFPPCSYPSDLLVRLTYCSLKKSNQENPTNNFSKKLLTFIFNVLNIP